MTAKQIRLLALLAFGDMSAAAVGHELGITRQTAAQKLHRFAAEGLVAKRGPMYGLSDQGRRAIGLLEEAHVAEKRASA